jgi:hypothetical protein
MKNILVLISISIFCFNYQICTLFYELNSDEWWTLRFILFSILFNLLTYLARIETKGTTRFLFNIMLGFTLSDLTDRVIYNDASFHCTDLLVIFVILVKDFVSFKRNFDER